MNINIVIDSESNEKKRIWKISADDGEMSALAAYFETIKFFMQRHGGTECDIYFINKFLIDYYFFSRLNYEDFISEYLKKNKEE